MIDMHMPQNSRHTGLYSMSSPALLGALIVATLIGIGGLRSSSLTAETSPIHHAATATREATIIPVSLANFQESVAYLNVQGDAANALWPNNGAVPVIAYGWGGDRPQSVRQMADSGNPAVFNPTETPPALIIQRRDDIFTPIFRRLVDQRETIPFATFTVNRLHGGKITYNLTNVIFLSMRDVGFVLDENPTTMEIVVAFSGIEIDHP
ncbi:MAG: hypothetical protein JWQ98_542 [Chlorobi bacterium]|nr:hypothetical protein [Chlorobiota bacterium]